MDTVLGSGALRLPLSWRNQESPVPRTSSVTASRNLRSSKWFASLGEALSFSTLPRRGQKYRISGAPSDPQSWCPRCHDILTGLHRVETDVRHPGRVQGLLASLRRVRGVLLAHSNASVPPLWPPG